MLTMHSPLSGESSGVCPACEATLKIGEVANRSGLTVKTMRSYCDAGLIQPISRSENVAPCPGVDSTRITPPWRRAIAWAMASPRPVPPC